MKYICGLLVSILCISAYGEVDVAILSSDDSGIILRLKPGVDDTVWNGWIGLPPGGEIIETDVRIAGSLRSTPHEGITHPVSSPLLTIGRVGNIRHHRVVPVSLRFILSAPNGGLAIPSIMELALRFSSDAIMQPGESGGFETILPHLIVNWREAQYWVEEKRDIEVPEPVPAPSIRIPIREDGFYRLYGEDLNVPAAVDPSSMAIWNRGVLIPIRVVIEEPVDEFKNTDWIEFYAEGRKRDDLLGRWTYVENKYGLDNAYYLVWDQSNPPRFTDQDASSSGNDPAAYHWWVLHNEANTVPSLSGHEGAIDDEWYWGGQFSPGSIVKPFTIPDLAEGHSQGEIRARFQAMSDYMHEISLFVNGDRIAASSWNGYGDTVIEGENLNLLTGANELEIVSSGHDYSRIHLDWFAIRYPRLYQVSAAQTAFAPSAEGRREYRIGGLNPGQRIELYESEAGIRFVGYDDRADENGYVYFRSQLPDTAVIWAVKPNGWNTVEDLPDLPVRVEPHQPVTDEMRRAEYLVIYPAEFLEAARSFRDLHLTNGDVVSADIVDIQHVFEEFSYGLSDPHALRTFLQWSLENWTDPPLYVLLLGDGTWDYNGYLNDQASLNLIPSYGNPASDNFYMSLNDTSYYPDIYLGRIPALNASQAWNAYEKVRRYGLDPEPSLWRKRVLFVNGGATQNDFDYFASWTNIISYFVVSKPPILGATQVIAKDAEGYWPGYYNSSIRAAVDSGCVVMNFFGHGATQTWDFMFETEDVDSLMNDTRLPLVLSPTCFTGDFANPRDTVFAEHFLRLDDEEHGAIGFFGSSGTAFQDKGGVYAYRILESLFLNDDRHIGPAIAWAKLNGDGHMTPEDSIMATVFNFLGDPLVSLVLPTEPDPHIDQSLVTIMPEEPAVGDSIRLDITVLNEGAQWDQPFTVRAIQGSQEIASGEFSADTLNNPGRLSWFAPLLPGPQAVDIVVDPDLTVPDIDRSDNEITLNIDYLHERPIPLMPPVDALIAGTTVDFIAAAIGDQDHSFQVSLSDAFDPTEVDSSGGVRPEDGLVQWRWEAPASGSYSWRVKGEGGAWSIPRWFTLGDGDGWGQFVSQQLSTLDMVNCEGTDLGIGLSAVVNTSQDFAHLDEGATVIEYSTCNTLACGPENLIGGQVVNSDYGGAYYFRQNDLNQYAIVDLGMERMIKRITSAHEGDTLTERSVWSYFAIESSTNDVDYELWGSTPDYSDSGYGPWIRSFYSYEKPYPIPVRYIKFSYGQCYPIGNNRAGSRVYEVYAYAASYPDSGYAISPVIGPAAGFGTLSTQGIVPEGTSARIRILTQTDDQWNQVVEYPFPGSFDLTGILQGTDLIRLQSSFFSESSDVTPRLTSWSVTFDAVPDIAAGNDTILISPALPVPGSNAAIEGVITNIGSSPASQVLWELWRSSDTADSVLHDSGEIGWLSPSMDESISVDWTAEPGITAFHLLLDPEDVIAEAVEKNNRIELEARILGNLTWEDTITVAPALPVPDEEIEISVIALNTGVLTTDETEAACYFQGANDSSFATIPELEPEESVVINMELTTPESPGEYTVVIDADPFGNVEEFSETDNRMFQVISVTEGADPAIVDVFTQCETPPVGDPESLFVRLTNLGGQPSMECLLYISDSSGWRDSISIETLTPTDTASVHMLWPTGVDPGDYTLTVHLDPDSLIFDTDRSNNIDEATISTVYLPDLRLQSLVFDPAEPAVGETLVVSMGIRNRGLASAGPYSVTVTYPDDTGADGSFESLDGQSTVYAEWTWIPNAPVSGPFTVDLDTDEDVEEACEDNNVYHIPLSVVLPWDIQLSAEGIQKADPSAEFVSWDSLDLIIVVENSGQRSAPSVSVELFDGAPESGGIRILNAVSRELSASEKDTISSVWPAESDPGSHLLVGIANREMTEEEWNIENNRSSRTISVRGDTTLPGTVIALPWPGFSDGDFLAYGDTIHAHGWDEHSGLSSLSLFLDDSDITGALVSRADSSYGAPGRVLHFPVVTGPGEHTVRVRTIDNAGLSAEDELQFTWSSQSVLRKVMAIPSPATSETWITAESSVRGSLDVFLYTVSGRMIRHIQEEARHPGRIRVLWDLLDEEGDQVANGVYLIRFVLHTETDTMSALGKLVVRR